MPYWDRQAILKLLRDHLPQQEYALVGYDAIAAWFARLGWRTRYGRPPAVRTLRAWKQRRGLPVARMPYQGTNWTTNYVLTAWCLTEGARVDAWGHQRRLSAR